VGVHHIGAIKFPEVLDVKEEMLHKWAMLDVNEMWKKTETGMKTADLLSVSLTKVQNMLTKHKHEHEEKIIASNAAVIQYLLREHLELAGNAAGDNRRRRIKPSDVAIAVHNDEGLNALWKNLKMPYKKYLDPKYGIHATQCDEMEYIRHMMKLKKEGKLLYGG